MLASDNLIQLIKQFEGFKAKPYLCPAGIPTIGYGSTMYPGGRSVTLKDPMISEAQAVIILKDTLSYYVAAVNRGVLVPLNQNQFDALVDFAYNVGVGALQKSTLLKKVNAKDFQGAANEFAKWTQGGGKELPGLVKRRAAEKALFTK